MILTFELSLHFRLWLRSTDQLLKRPNWLELMELKWPACEIITEKFIFWIAIYRGQDLFVQNVGIV